MLKVEVLSVVKTWKPLLGGHGWHPAHMNTTRAVSQLQAR